MIHPHAQLVKLSYQGGRVTVPGLLIFGFLLKMARLLQIVVLWQRMRSEQHAYHVIKLVQVGAKTEPRVLLTRYGGTVDLPHEIFKKYSINFAKIQHYLLPVERNARSYPCTIWSRSESLNPSSLKIASELLGAVLSMRLL